MRHRFVLALLAAGPLLATQAQAAPVTAVFDFESSGFAGAFGTGMAPPIDPFSLVVSLTFDPATGDQFDNMAGVRIVRSSLAFPGGLAFDYDSANDALTFGGNGLGGIGITAGTNDIIAQVNTAYTGTPGFGGMAYTTSTTNDVFESFTGTVTRTFGSGTAVPEPGSVALLLSGLAALGLRRRRS